MSNELAKDCMKDAKSKMKVAEGFKDLQAEITDRLNRPQFHGSLVLTFNFFDSGVTSYEIDTKKRSKTE